MKFTVLIPTCERAETLFYAIKTCVQQDYEQLEIIVSDNFSRDNTRDVVESFSDRRIRYLNTGTRVGMSSNLEFALSHVLDGYVTYMGDDDGLMPNALSDAASVIEETSTLALSWLKAHYFWPNSPIPEIRDLLYYSPYNYLLRFKSRDFIRACQDLLVPWERFPSLYNAFVQMDVLQALKDKTGKFFYSVCPDYYSGFALLSQLDNYLYSSRPFSVAGTASHSAGAWYREGSNDNAEMKKYWNDFALDVPVHPRMKLLPRVMMTALVEPFMQANDHCFGGKIKINMKRVFQRMFAEASALDGEEYHQVWREVLELAKQHNLLRHAVRYKEKRKSLGLHAKLTGKGSYTRNDLIVNAAKFGVNDAFGAAELVGKLVGDYSRPEKIISHWYLSMIQSGFCAFLDRMLESKAKGI